MPKSSHAAPLVIVAGKERRFFNSETLAASFLASEGRREDVDSCVHRLHKRLLVEMEKLLGCKKFNGIAAAQAELRRSFVAAEADTFVHRELRALHEAYRLVRHVTEVGEDVYFAKFTAAFVRMERRKVAAEPEPNEPVVVASTHGTTRRRRRRGKKGAAASLIAPVGGDTDMDDSWADGLSSTPAAAAAVAPASRCSRRSLERGPSDESAQPLLKKSLSVPTFKIGDVVVIQKLVSRPELAGQTAVVVALPAADQPRFGVKLTVSGEQLLVKEANLKPSIFGPGAGV